jgi:cysteine desulfurase/selenocysteine lyase
MMNSNIRNHFKALKTGKVYLDSAATSLTPDTVVDKMAEYYNEYPSNVHRGNYAWGDVATEEYEGTRDKIKDWCNAHNYEVVFSSGATFSSNLIYYNLSNLGIKKSIVSLNDHHANIVPYRLHNTDVEQIEIPDNGVFNDEELFKFGSLDAHMLHISGVFNATGQILDIEKITHKAKDLGALVALDMSQHMSHDSLDADKVNADFYYWSSHKHYGPTGTGILLIKKDIIKHIKPIIGGGAMVSNVTDTKTEMWDAPLQLEAGTPNIAGVIGTGASIDFMQDIGMNVIHDHTQNLLGILIKELRERKIPLICDDLELKEEAV